MIEVRFLCDHTLAMGDKVDASPRCPVCGETKVRSVKPNRLPRFTGTVTGPMAEFKGLEPGVVNVATAGPLRLREESK